MKTAAMRGCARNTAFSREDDYPILRPRRESDYRKLPRPPILRPVIRMSPLAFPNPPGNARSYRQCQGQDLVPACPGQRVLVERRKKRAASCPWLSTESASRSANETG